MCGILFGYRTDEGRVAKKLAKRFEVQKSRGTQGFGYLPIRDGVLGQIKRSVDEKGIMAHLKGDLANAIMFHHRFPTSTPNFEGATHPIYVTHESLDWDYYLIHNGVIRNASSLKDIHEKKGFEYTTEYKEESTITFKNSRSISKVKETGFNDSEALAVEVARYIDGDTASINATGTIAFICTQVHKKTGVVNGVYFGHNSGNPLILEDNRDKGKHGMLFVKSVGAGVALPTDRLFCLDIKTGKITQREVAIGTDFASRSPYDHSSNSGYQSRQMGYGTSGQHFHDKNVGRKIDVQHAGGETEFDVVAYVQQEQLKLPAPKSSIESDFSSVHGKLVTNRKRGLNWGEDKGKDDERDFDVNFENERVREAEFDIEVIQYDDRNIDAESESAYAKIEYNNILIRKDEKMKERNVLGGDIRDANKEILDYKTAGKLAEADAWVEYLKELEAKYTNLTLEIDEIDDELGEMESTYGFSTEQSIMTDLK